MSLRDQAQNLMARGAAMRQEIFGECTVEFFADKIEGKPDFIMVGYHSPFRRVAKTQQAGFFQTHDAIVRVGKRGGFIPEVNKFIRVTLHDPGRTQFRMTINEMPHHTAGVEWVLGCGALL